MSERIWKSQIGHWLEMNSWLKSCLRFCHVWMKQVGGCEKIVQVSESFWSSLKFLRVTDLTAWLWGWNVRVNGMRSVFSFSAVCSADCRSICWARWWPLERRKQDSHVYRKTSTLPLIFRKNQSRHHINDEVWETVKKVWSSWRGMDAKMNTTSNYVGL